MCMMSIQLLSETVSISNCYGVYRYIEVHATEVITLTLVVIYTNHLFVAVYGYQSNMINVVVV